MGSKLCEASAPGSFIFMGEYSVLYGGRAIVCSIDRRIRVSIKFREGEFVRVFADYGSCQMKVSKLSNYMSSEGFRYVLCSLFMLGIDVGVDVNVVSEIPNGIGLSSSAAVTVATIKGICEFLGKDVEDKELFLLSLDVVRKVQGFASGADVAAAVWGGVMVYENPGEDRSKEVVIDRLTRDFPPWFLVFSGDKASTLEVVSSFRSRYEKVPEVFDDFFVIVSNCVKLGWRAILEKDFDILGFLMNVHHGILDAFGVSSSKLSEIVYRLREFSGNIFGSKISGAGGGDCVVALGRGEVVDIGYDIFEVNVAVEGVCEATRSC